MSKRKTITTLASNNRVFREFATELLEHSQTVESFIKYILPYVIRDESVQREGVWDRAQKEEYISWAVVGSSKFTSICLVDLAATKEKALKQRDLAFVRHLENLMKPSKEFPEGAKWAHLDGGNRCDDFISFAKGQINVLKGDYQFQPVTYEDGTQEPNGHCEEIKEDSSIEELKERHPIIYEKLMKQPLVVFSFTDLDQDERANMFKILNAGENLNDQENRNPSPADICSTIRDELNRLWNPLFIKVGAITEKKAERFGFCQWLANLAIAFSDHRFVPSFGNKAELDEAYKPGSNPDKNTPKFVQFFNIQFLPYVKLMQENDWTFPHKELFHDFFLLLKYMAENNLKIPNVNKEGREKLWTSFVKWQATRFADITEAFPLKQGHTKWSGLFSKKSEVVLKFRLEGMINGCNQKYTTYFDGKPVENILSFGSFIEQALNEGVIVKLDPKRVADISDKSFLFLNQSKTSTGKEIPVGQYSDTKKFQADHVKPHARGGKTLREEMKLEETEYNRSKGAKAPEEMETI